jgi:hypothetical protein
MRLPCRPIEVVEAQIGLFAPLLHLALAPQLQAVTDVGYDLKRIQRYDNSA